MADNTYQMAMELVDEVSPALESIKDKLTDVMNSAGGMGKALGGVAVGIGTTVAVMQVLESASNAAVLQIAALADQANRLGMSVEDLQVFTGTMRAFGVPLDRSVDALTDMKERIGEARQGSGEMLAVLNELNIPLKAANGEWVNSQSIIDTLIMKLVNMDDAARRVRLSAQAGGDATRDMIGNIAQQPEMLEKIIRRNRENLVISDELAATMREVRIELEMYNSSHEATSQVTAAALAPVAQRWRDVKTEVGLAAANVARFFRLSKQPDLGQQLAETAAKLAIARRDYEDFGGDAGNNRLFSGAWKSAQENVRMLQAQYDTLRGIMDDLSSDSPPLPTEVVTQSAAQMEGERKAIAAAERARKEAQVRAIADFEQQANAELALLKESLNAEMEEQITANYITNDQLERIKAEYGARILAEEQMTAQKISAFRKTEAEKNLREEKSTNDAREAQMKRFHSVLQGIVADQVIAEKTAQALRDAQSDPTTDVEAIKRAAQRIEEMQRLNEMLDEMNLTTERRTELENSLTEALYRRDVAQGVLDQSERIGKFNEMLEKYVEEARKSEAIVNNTEDQLELDLARVEAKKMLLRELTAEEDAALKLAITQKQQFDELARNAEDSAKEMERIYATAAENIQGAFSDFFFDVMQGNMTNLADSFKRTIDRMVAELLASQLFKMVGGIGNGTAAGGGLSGMFAGLFSGISGRATGGPINSGTPYWVGEEGPEIVVPRGNGTVIPADVSEAMVSGKGSGGESYHISINALDSKSFMDMIERDDRSIVKALANAQQKYRM